MTQFDEAYDQFGDLSTSAVSGLSGMIALIEEGIAPATDRSERLLDTLRELRASYEHVRALARQELGDAFDSTSESPASQYQSQLYEFRAQAINRQVEAAKRLLVDFMRVESKAPFYMDALRPIQDGARDVFEALSSDPNSIVVEGDIPRVSIQRDFMNALDMDDFGSGDGIELLNRIREGMSMEVMLGLTQKSYYLPEAPSQYTPIEMAVQGDACEATPIESKAEELGAADTASESSEATATDSEGSGDSDTGDQSGVQFEVKDAPAGWDDPIRPIRPVKATAKLGVRQLERKLLTRIAPGDRDIISILMRFGACTPDQIISFARVLTGSKNAVDEKGVESCILKLERADAACTFDVDGKAVHVLTLAGRRVLMKETVREPRKGNIRVPFWPIPFEEHECKAGLTIRPSELRRVVTENTELLERLRLICDSKGKRAATVALKGTHRINGAYVLEDEADEEQTREDLSDGSHQADGPSASDTPDGTAGTHDANPIAGVGEKSPANGSVNPDQAEQQQLEAKAAASDVTEVAKGASLTEEDETDSLGSNEEVSVVHDGDIQPVEIDALCNGEMDDSGILEGSTDLTDVISIRQQDSSSRVPYGSEPAGDGEEKLDPDLDTVVECEHASASVSDRVSRFIEEASCQPDEIMRDLAMDMICEVAAGPSEKVDKSGLATAITLMRAASGIEDYDECFSLYRKLQYALEPFSEEVEYTSSGLADAFDKHARDEEGLLLAAHLNAMAFPMWGREDHDLWSVCRAHLDLFESRFPSYGIAKPLFHALLDLHETSSVGFGNKVLRQLDNSKSVEAQLEDLAERAKAIDAKSINVRHRYATEFSDRCVGNASDVGRAVRMVAGLLTPVDEDFLRSMCERFCDSRDGGYVASSDKILGYVKGAWHDALEEHDKNKSRIEPIKTRYSDPAVSACKERINLVVEWVAMNGDIDSKTLAELRSMRKRVIKEVEAIIESDALVGRPGSPVVECALRGLKKYLEGDSSAWVDHSCFLSSGFVSLDDSLIPIVNDKLNTVTYAEPWRNVLRHYLAEPLTLEQARQKIDGDPDSVMYDNLTQLAHIRDLLGAGPTATEKRKAQATRAADAGLERFENELEMDVLYDLIDDNQKETIDSTWRAYKEYFYEIGDFGVWAQFLAALRRQVGDFSRVQYDILARKLDERYRLLGEDEDTSLLDMARKMLDEEPNFATVEECINLFDEGERTFIEEAGNSMSADEISDLLNDEKHEALYIKCVQQMLTNEAFSVAARQILRGIRLGEKEESLKTYAAVFLHWPDDGPKDYDAKDVGHLLRGFGLNVRSPKLVRYSNGCAQFEIDQQRACQGQTDYPHPISKFGTDAPSKLQVLVFSEHVDTSTLFNEVEKLQNTDMTVVVVDKALSLRDRRDMTEVFHKVKTGLAPFICIDRVLAVYLATIKPGDRLPELLRCTLPFTRYQPFSLGRGSIKDEMFVGRADELRRIVDPMGASLVYGGRQLGKSVLLEQAERYFSNRNEKYVSAYCKLDRQNTDDQLVEAVVSALRAKKLKLPQRIHGIAELCDSLDRALRDKRAERILLLIDEADEYLKAIRPNNYANVNPMVSLMRKTKGSFKFVFAGLHNVIRARKAFEDNGTLGQFDTTVCIKPLARKDALRLIERPLSYLGYHVDEYPHLMTILTKTNYYPGILQLFGYTLVESIAEHYGRYYRAADGNPPYTLSPKQLAEILKRRELKDSIRSRFQMSLDISERYTIIARLIALLYRECEENDENIRERDGFEAAEMWTWVEEMQFPAFENDDRESFVGLLDEMCEMNILFKNDGAVPMYRLRHYDFLSFIGGDTVDEILDDLGRFA